MSTRIKVMLIVASIVAVVASALLVQPSSPKAASITVPKGWIVQPLNDTAALKRIDAKLATAATPQEKLDILGEEACSIDRVMTGVSGSINDTMPLLNRGNVLIHRYNVIQGNPGKGGAGNPQHLITDRPVSLMEMQHQICRDDLNGMG